jgi:hypothetical protein
VKFGPGCLRVRNNKENKMRIGELVDVVKAARVAHERERRGILNFQQGVTEDHGLLCQDEFWSELDRLVGIVRQFRDVYKRTNWPEQATDEFFRSAVYAASRISADDVEGALVKCIRFVATYEDEVNRIYKALEYLEEEGHEFGLSDDGFGDLCDSFPLHGRAAYSALVEDGMVPKKPYLGENYVAMYLNRAAVNWVRNCVENKRRETEE